MKCPRCGKDGGEGDNCVSCGKNMDAKVIASELSEKETELQTAMAELESLRPMKAELETAKAAIAEAESKVTAAEDKSKTTAEELKAAQDKIAADKAERREHILKPLLTEAMFKEKLVTFQAMDDETFETVTASLLEAKPTTRIPALRAGMPSPVLDSAQSGKIRLK